MASSKPNPASLPHRGRSVPATPLGGADLSPDWELGGCLDTYCAFLCGSLRNWVSSYWRRPGRHGNSGGGGGGQAPLLSTSRPRAPGTKTESSCVTTTDPQCTMGAGNSHLDTQTNMSATAMVTPASSQHTWQHVSMATDPCSLSGKRLRLAQSRNQ